MNCERPKLKKTLLATFEGKKGFAFGGRCAGGAGRGFGGEYLIIAANDEVLATIWEALEGCEIDTAKVYDASAIGTYRVAQLAEPESECHAQGGEPNERSSEGTNRRTSQE